MYQYTAGMQEVEVGQNNNSHFLTSEAPMLGLGHFVDDYLLDFDIYHVSHVTELLLYIDTKYLSSELGRFSQFIEPRLPGLWCRWDQ